MIIVGSYCPDHKPGDRITILTGGPDETGVRAIRLEPPQPAVIVRRASRDEYVSFCRSAGFIEFGPEQDGSCYYEATTD